METRRMLLAMTLCFMVLLLHMYYSELASQKDAGTAPGVDSPGGTTPGVVRDTPPAGNGARPPVSVGTPPTPSAPAAGDPPPDLATFEPSRAELASEELRVELSSEGASVTAVTLLQHEESVGRPGEKTLRPVRLMHPDLESRLAFTVAFPQGGLPVDTVHWELVGQEQNTVTFRYPLPGGDLVKVFTLQPEGFLLDIEVRWPEGALSVATDYELRGPERIRHDVTSWTVPNQRITGYAGAGGALADVLRVSVAAMDRSPYVDGARDVLWTGLASNYFACMMRPLGATGSQQKPWRAVVYQSSNLMPERPDPGLQVLPYQVGIRREVEEGVSHGFQCFLGPKSSTVLAASGDVGYTELVEYGWFWWLVRPFLALLNFFHSICGSYGIGIIFLTVLVKLTLHPLNKRNQGVMQRNQKKMAKIQPQMKELRERHKNDPMKANKAIQELMKEHNVNPAQMMGGCLMMFLQLPIWIGLYRTFSLAFELRRQSFLYIEDLTQPDRLFGPFNGSLPLLGWDSVNVLPVIYVILTLINQRMMPKSDDPQMQQQQKMMSFMMVAFGFIFYNFSSGLMLYFLTNAGLGILEQRIIRAELNREEQAAEQKATSTPKAKPKATPRVS